MGRDRKRKHPGKSYGSYVATDSSAPPSTFRATVAYDGKAFMGFQAQDKTPPVRTVQAVLEDAVKRTTGESVRIRGASRTDKGVHARGQVISFESTVVDDSTFLRAINTRLPDDVAVVALAKVSSAFDPRKDSTCKCYSYRIYNGAIRQVLGRELAWQVAKPLDVAAMQAAAVEFISDAPRDCSALTPTRRLEEDASTMCHVVSAEVETAGDEVHITFKGDRFLYRMVRNMVGILVDVGLHKKSRTDVAAIVQSSERVETGGAPPHGLVLEWIQYLDETSAASTPPSSSLDQDNN
ncbi:tRNA pseudouridine synthase A [Achlya hypogyna]|uniref:tRNA pseudouridine synthase n=1 Tax=Achlya hypogyna TaxID=1202772 RepID=A0A1V9Z494_ACHHY|nr:tRNA pseudouridine synthase A [Achlya hypogyna]